MSKNSQQVTVFVS